MYVVQSLEFWLCHIPAVWLWAGYVTSLCPSFLVCEKKVITVYTTGLLQRVNESTCVNWSGHCLAQSQPAQ